MKLTAISVLALLISVIWISPVLADDQLGGTVSISPPSSATDFEEMYKEHGKSPEGAAALFIVAFVAFMEDPEMGTPCLTIAMDDGLLADGDAYNGKKPGNSIQYHLRRVKGKKYLAYSYVIGTSPDNGYAPPAPPYKVVLTSNKYSRVSENRIKLFVKCSGADTPRPITLEKQDDGYWKTAEASTIFVGIRSPK